VWTGRGLQSNRQGCEKVTRMRFAFSKRNLCCFIPHVVLPQVFARAGIRAGIYFEYSEGFSPRPRISIGPALPVGVIGLRELFDAEIRNWESAMLEQWNGFLPDGISLVEYKDADGPSLGKACTAASYMLYVLKQTSLQEIIDSLNEQLPVGSIIAIGPDPGGSSIMIDLKNPQQNSPGLLVKALVNSDIIGSWSDVRIVRTRIGFLEVSTVRTLM